MVTTYRNYKAISCAWRAGKKEFSAVVVKVFKSFFQLFPVPDGESEQSCAVLELEGHQYGRGLISERSYPSAVEPAALNGSIRERVVCCWILAIYADEPQISRPTRCRA